MVSVYEHYQNTVELSAICSDVLRLPINMTSN